MCVAGKQVIYGVHYYLWFQLSTVSLGTYPQGPYCDMNTVNDVSYSTCVSVDNIKGGLRNPTLKLL